MTSRMGLYAAKLGDQATALSMTEKAITAQADNPNVRFRAAVVYEITGKRDAALNELSIAQRLGYPTALVATEPDLLALRSDPRFDLLRMERE